MTADGYGLDLGAATSSIDWMRAEACHRRLRFDGTSDLADEIDEWADALEPLVAEVRRLSAAPSFSNPVPLTAALLAEHGGTLPDGSWVARGGAAWRVEGGTLVDGWRPLCDMTESGWSVVHLAVHLGAES